MFDTRQEKYITPMLHLLNIFKKYYSLSSQVVFLLLGLLASSALLTFAFDSAKSDNFKERMSKQTIHQVERYMFNLRLLR